MDRCVPTPPILFLFLQDITIHCDIRLFVMVVLVRGMIISSHLYRSCFRPLFWWWVMVVSRLRHYSDHQSFSATSLVADFLHPSLSSGDGHPVEYLFILSLAVDQWCLSLSFRDKLLVDCLSSIAHQFHSSNIVSLWWWSFSRGCIVILHLANSILCHFSVSGSWISIYVFCSDDSVGVLISIDIVVVSLLLDGHFSPSHHGSKNKVFPSA